MPRIIHDPLAMTSGGALLLNLAQLDLPGSPQALLEVARTMPSTLFLGVVMTTRERAWVQRELSMLLPGATLPVLAARNRRSRAR